MPRRMMRGHGEGTIVRRADGRWVAAVSVPDGTRSWIYGRTRKEVSDRLTDVLSDLRKGVMPAPARVTVADLLNQWLEDGAKGSVRDSTYRSYSDIVRLHLIPTLGSARLVKLRPVDVEKMLRQKLDEGLSPRRVQFIHAVLRRGLGRAVRWGWVAQNAASLCDVPRVPHREIEPLKPAETRALLQVLRGERLEAMYVTALACGLRRGELLGLVWEDVDLGRGVLTVRRSLQRVSGRTLLAEPKTARSRRTLQLPGFVLVAWRAHRARQAAERLAAGDRWQEMGFVFTTLEGRPLEGMNVTHHFQRLLARAGVRKRRFHDLRHSCATVLMAQGVPARVAMEILGHSQIGVTMNTYTHVLDQLSRDAADHMDAYLQALVDRDTDAATNPAG